KNRNYVLFGIWFHATARWTGCNNALAAAGYGVWYVPRLSFCGPLSASVYCPWKYHGVFRGDGFHFWPDQLHCAIADWCSRSGFAIYEYARFLAVCCRCTDDKYVLFVRRRVCSNWLAGCGAIIG